MDERDLGIELDPQAVDQGQGERDLRDEDHGRAARLDRRHDRLDVDRRLAAARDPVEEQRRRVARRDRPQREADRFGLGLGEGRVRRARASPPDRATLQRPALGDRRGHLHEAAPDEPSKRPVAVPVGELRRADRAAVRGQLGEEGDLARPETRAVGPATGRQGGGDRPARLGGGRQPVGARRGAGGRQRPVEGQPAGVGQPMEAPQEAGPALGGAELVDPPGAVRSWSRIAPSSSGGVSAWSPRRRAACPGRLRPRAPAVRACPAGASPGSRSTGVPGSGRRSSGRARPRAPAGAGRRSGRGPGGAWSVGRPPGRTRVRRRRPPRPGPAGARTRR